MTHLHTLTLTDGLPTESAGKPMLYKLAHLRDTTVADERWATEKAERVVMVGNQHKLLVSDATFAFALTARHIEAFECDGQRITQAMIGEGWLDLVGKLSPHDFGLIETKILEMTLAAEVRNGHITQAQFEALMGGQAQQPQQAPQPVGQAAELGAHVAHAEPGPALLADFAGNDTDGATAGNAR